MTILISGSTGFLGSYLLKSFIKNGYEVIGLKRSTSNTYRIDDNLNQCINYDIDKIELKNIFENHKIDIVINTVTSYGKSDTKISSILDTNLIFGFKLLEESVLKNIKVFINTDTLLDKNINAYALSKSQLVDWMKFLSNKSTKMINVRMEHMYGLGDDDSKLIYWVINQLKQNVKKIDLTTGSQKRDFIYITDVVSAFNIIIENIDKLSNYEEFELGGGNSIEVKKIIKLLYSELLKQQTIETVLNFGAIKYRENENMNMIADISKLKNLAWVPTVSIENGIQLMLNREKND